MKAVYELKTGEVHFIEETIRTLPKCRDTKLMYVVIIL